MIVEGFLIGALAAVTVLYALQTRTLYPKWMLQTFYHPWILLLVLIISIVAYPYMPRAAALLIIITGALWIDAVLFAQEPLRSTGNRMSAVTETYATGGHPADSSSSTAPAHTAEVSPFDGIGDLLTKPAVTFPIFPTFFGADLMQPGSAAPLFS